MAEAKRTLLDKWKVVREAAKDNKRLSSGDVAILIALCDRYGSKSRPDAPPMAGHALLASMAGLSRRAAIDSTRRLIDTGYISVLQLGVGTRGTTYNLNFVSSEPDFTTSSESLSGEPQFTSVVNLTSPLAPSSGEPQFTESPPTVTPLQGGLLVGTSAVAAAPSAPPLAGLAAATADTAGFERIWVAYDKYGDKEASRVAYAAIANPDVDHIAARAAAWCKSAKPGKRRMPLERWLAREKYDEKDRKVTPVDKPSKAKPTADNDNEADEAKPFVPVDDLGMFAQPGRFHGRVTEAQLVTEQIDDNVNHTVVVTLRGADGEGVEHHIRAQCADEKQQIRGQRHLDALGGCTTGDVSDLVGREFYVTIGEDHSIRYDAVPTGIAPLPKVLDWRPDMPRPPRLTGGANSPLRLMLAKLESIPPESEAERQEREEYEADSDRRAKAFAARWVDDDLDEAA